MSYLRERSDSHLLSRILRSFVPTRRYLALYGAVTLIGALCLVATPLVTRRLIDHGLAVGDRHAAIRYALLVLALGLSSAFMNAASSALASRVAVELILRLRRDIYTHLHRLQLDFFENTQAGMIQNRITNDVMGAQGMVQTLFGTLITNSITLGAAMVTMFILSPYMPILALALGALILLPVRAVARNVKALARQQATDSALLSAMIAERMNASAARLFRTFGHADVDIRQFDKLASALRDTVHRRNRTFAISSGMLAALGAVGVGSVYLVAATTAESHRISVGSAVALAVLVQQVYGPLSTFATQGIEVQSGLVAFERIFSLLDLPAAHEPTDSHNIPVVPGGQLSLRGVGATYHVEAMLTAEGTATGRLDGPTPEPALSDVNMEIPAGKTIALVGKSGAGKSTLAALIMGLREPSAGQLLLDGIPYTEISKSTRQRIISLVSQDALILHESLRDNLRVASPEASDSEILDALARAQLSPVLERLPAGLDTTVGDRGFSLSGGEKQRLALARVFLRRPSVVILDEATANLDSVTEAAIAEALDGDFKHATKIIISHHIKSISNADLIALLVAGKLVAFGPPDELRAHPRFAELMLAAVEPERLEET